MVVFRKICPALFILNTRFEIRPFALLPTIKLFSGKVSIFAFHISAILFFTQRKH